MKSFKRIMEVGCASDLVELQSSWNEARNVEGIGRKESVRNSNREI